MEVKERYKVNISRKPECGQESSKENAEVSLVCN
jgi:hypothetical protein